MSFWTTFIIVVTVGGYFMFLKDKNDTTED